MGLNLNNIFNIAKKNLKFIFIVLIVIFLTILLGLFYYFRNFFYQNEFIANFLNLKSSENIALETSTISNQILNEESVVIDVVEKVSNSVVSIVYLDDIFSDTKTPIGSGVVVSSDGLIVTNKHVVEKEDVAYEIIFQNGTKHRVSEIIRDKSKDLALIKIDASNLTPIPLSNSNKLKLGQKAIAVGNSLGFSNTVSVGIVSGLGREVEIDGDLTKNLIQTDAAINPGNSGGALLNSNGDLVGINTARSNKGDNIGFAIPVNYISELLDKYKNGKLDKNSFPGFLGIGFVYRDLQDYLKRGLPIGPVITGVLAGSPADRAGLKSGDIIVSIDGVEFSDESELTEFIKEKNPGDAINLKIYRKNNTLNLQAVLVEAKN